MSKRLKLWGSRRPRGTRIFFATDIHGSDVCFRKWLNSGKAYDADAVILGGDITGKSIVPIVAEGSSWRADVRGEELRVEGERGLTELVTRIRGNGLYELILTPEEKQAMDADSRLRTDRVQKVVTENVERWVALADERLSDSERPYFVMLGNDDEPELATILRKSARLRFAEDGVCRLPGDHEMVSFGYSTPTPWATPREMADATIAQRLAEVTSALSEPARAVFNFHCPPFATQLDQAPSMGPDGTGSVGAADTVTMPVGSKAVRDEIERHQPVLGLHGHVHESGAAQELGTTLCLNPGSDYANGVLRGTIVELGDDRVLRWQFTQG